jgi:hypothetical protein
VEQAATIDVVGCDQLGLLLLDVLNVLDSERPGLIVHVERLDGITVVV